MILNYFPHRKRKRVRSFSIDHVIVALSNLSYVFLAFWLARKEFIFYAYLLFAVAIVSTYFHLNPNSENLLYFDIATSVLTSIICFLHFLPYVKPSFLFVFTVGLVVTATTFWAESGDDRECSKYVWYHSIWHVLTALTLYLIIQCTDLKTGKDLKLHNYPVITGGNKT
jgi:hypothetical protein